jgi:hypothetical protein
MIKNKNRIITKGNSAHTSDDEANDGYNNNNNDDDDECDEYDYSLFSCLKYHHHLHDHDLS